MYSRGCQTVLHCKYASMFLQLLFWQPQTLATFYRCTQRKVCFEGQKRLGLRAPIL